MSKKMLFILSAVCDFAAIAMFLVGSNSSHLTELKDFFWVPLVPGIVLALVATKKAS